MSDKEKYSNITPQLIEEIIKDITINKHLPLEDATVRHLGGGLYQIGKNGPITSRDGIKEFHKAMKEFHETMGKKNKNDGDKNKGL